MYRMQSESRFTFSSYFYMPSPDLEKQIIVSDCTGYTFSKDFYYNRETFNNNLVMHVLYGTLYVKQYGKTYILTEDDSILMSLNDAHTYYADKNDVPLVSWFHFKGAPIDPVIQSLREYQQLPIRFRSEEIRDTIFQCMHLFSNPQKNFEIQLSALLYPVLLEIMEPYMLKIHNRTIEMNSWFTDAVNRYINDHIFEKIELDDLCSCVNMKKCYFCKVFKRFFPDTSPIQYVTRVKIEYSKRLLHNSFESLDTIAHSLGFADQSHFSKIFKKHVGTTPLRFRKTGNAVLEGKEAIP